MLFGSVFKSSVAQVVQRLSDHFCALHLEYLDSKLERAVNDGVITVSTPYASFTSGDLEGGQPLTFHSGSMGFGNEVRALFNEREAIKAPP